MHAAYLRCIFLAVWLALVAVEGAANARDGASLESRPAYPSAMSDSR